LPHDADLPVDWARVKDVLMNALARDGHERRTYLEAQCGANVSLRREVESLLAAAAQSDALFEAPTISVDGASISGASLNPSLRLAPTAAIDATEEESTPAPVDTHAFHGTDRYRVRRQIGIGGMGVVYEVEDRVREQRVALKTLLRWNADDIYRLKWEFRSLADIAHPNLASLYELVVDADHCFFTMELVDGVTFVEYVRGAANAPDIGRLRRLLAQLVSAVLALHAHGKLHRDIKPSNVLITREERLVVLDFGLTSNLTQDDVLERGLAGTIAYLSPEECLGAAVTEASDWYAVGATMYQALTGEPPFDGTMLEIVQRKTSEDPPVVADIVGVPPDIASICTALLCRHPLERMTGREALARLHAQSDFPAPGTIAPAPRLIGRDEELHVMRSAFADVKQGRGRTILIHGPSGIGKTALVQRFFDELYAEPHIALRGRCHELESMPYEGLDRVMDGLRRYLSALPPTSPAAPLRDMPRGALTRVFPVLMMAGDAEPPASESPVGPIALRNKAIAELRELFGRLAALQPLVIEIDDFHWAEADTTLFLQDLLHGSDAPQILLVISFRSEEIEAKPFLRRLLDRTDMDSQLTLPVPPLTDADARRLIAVLHPGAAIEMDSAPPDVFREAAGNPFLVEELARSLALGLNDAHDATLAGVIERRTMALPPEARAFLSALAICGRPVIAARIFEACGLQGDERPLIAKLQAAHFLRRSQSPDHVEIYHDRIRQALAAAVPDDTARQIHQDLARILVSHGDDDPESLSEHYRAAGHPEPAAVHAAIAAARAAAVLAFDRAANLYRDALELDPHSEQQLAWTLGLAQALENAGRPADAGDAYLAAARAVDGLGKVKWLRKAAEQALIGGHIDRGLQVTATVLELLGMRLPASPRRAVATIAIGRARLAWRGLAFAPRDEADIAPEDLLRIDTCWTVCTGLLVVDTTRAAAFHTRHLLSALDAGEPSRIARALALAGCLSAAGGGAGSITRAAAFIDRAHQLAANNPQPYLRALSTLTAGIGAFASGRWNESTVLCERALTMLRDDCTGVAWELGLAYTFFLGSLFYRGQLTRVSHWLPTLLQSARERGNLYVEAELASRFNMVWLIADNPAEGERQADAAMARWSDSGYHRQHYNRLHARIQTALYRGDDEEAWALVTTHMAAARRNMWLRVQLMRVETAFLHARCAIAMASRGVDVRRMRRTAARGAQRLAREGTPTARAFSSLIRASLAGVDGNHEEAAARLTQAVDDFTAADMQLFTAVCRRRLAALVGGDRGASLRREAEAWMADQEVRNPMAVCRLLAPGLPE
jgi:tetratricopeptide (TPR) repeat protein